MTMAAARTRLALVALAAAAACSSSNNTPAVDGAPNAVDAPAANPDAKVVSPDAPAAGPDASSMGLDGGTAYTCATTIATYCVPATKCVLDFADVPTCGSPLDSIATCGSLHAWVVGGIDTVHTSYYDAGGHLVAIVDFVLHHLVCTAGPASFFAPDCQSSVPLGPCPDAGT